MKIVTTADVRQILQQWLAGKLNAHEVQEWAESRFLSEEWEPESKSINCILSELDRMDMNLITVEEAPIFLNALDALNPLRIIGDHFASRDLMARKRALAADPMYAPFCKDNDDV
jgi:hypothetical protein